MFNLTSSSQKLLGSVTIAQGGVLPNIHSVLLPKKSESEHVGGGGKAGKKGAKGGKGGSQEY